MVVWKDSLMVFGGAPGIQQNGVQVIIPLIQKTLL